MDGKNIKGIAIAAIVTAAGIAAVTSNKAVQLPSKQSTAVEQSNEQAATAYYKKTALSLGLLGGDRILQSTLDDLLTYLGYENLLASDLEQLPSDSLMDFVKLKSAVSNSDNFEKSFKDRSIKPGELLASRFFAPKITDDSTLPPDAYGWRKLIRLNPRLDSAAAQHGISSAFILFNFFEKDPNRTSFRADLHSANTQVILVNSAPSAKSDLDPIYWLDYDTSAKISFELDAFFDARDPILPKKKPYFVPSACVACHGNQQKPLANYFDTDAWIDRTLPGQDFKLIGQSPNGVLFDGGTDTSSSQYRAAYDVIRRLNIEMAAQNAAIHPNSIQKEAVDNWLANHKDSSEYIPPIDRPIRRGPLVWTKGNAVDEKLLPLLSNYCFRCHGSVSFNVFDKNWVAANTFKIKARITAADRSEDPNADIGLAMPPDRKISPEDKKAILELLETLNK